MKPALLTTLAALLLAQPLLAQPPRQKEELVDQVKNAIDRGVNYLRRSQSPQGHWEKGGIIGPVPYTGGQTCLALLALLNAGVKPDDPAIQNALRFIRTIPPSETYVVALQTMVLAEVGDPRDKLQIQNNVNWLLRPIPEEGANFIGWTYGPGFKQQFGALLSSDFSNTQYALLGLEAGKRAGAIIPDAAWRPILELYKKTQQPGGSWGYMPSNLNDRPRLTMTTAGLGSLHIAGMELNKGRQELNKNTGVAAKCGEYDEDPNIRRALDWLANAGRFSFDNEPIYYNAYGIERAGRYSGRRFLGNRDWYREGCEFLVKNQLRDDSWSGSGMDGGTLGSTAFALLFLSKGRTPVLLSKLSWGNNEWNNKHHDVKYITEFASRELFKKTPLAWQIYDCRKAEQNRITHEAAELLQLPILYLNGHEAPRLTGVQKAILKKYIQEGGFVLAEACCGRAEFAKGFRDLMKELFEKDMTEVPADHALYRAFAPLKPNEAAMFPLERLDLGCKTVVVLATKPLAGYWEENLNRDGKGLLAFRLAGNIVAYATNMELPKPRLTKVDIADEKVEIKVTRNYLEVGQVRHSGDWEPAPGAMQNLMQHLRKEYGLDVSLKKRDVRLSNAELFQHKFLYMHGRGRFTYDENVLKNLRAHLKTGGLLLGDACCGSKEFDAAFREMVNKLFADAKLEKIPDEDPLFSADLNGRKIERVMCRRPRPGSDKLELQPMRPALEGIKQGGRWVVIYSPYDIGCALEKHPSSDCIGHDHDGALRLASAAVLYYLRN